MFTPSGILDSSWLRGPGTIAQKAAAAVRVANPELDPVVSRQARFRVSGTGPLSSRAVTPVTPGAAILAAQDGRAEQAVRNVLRLIEDQAGGPDRSANLAFNGVAFSDSADGLAANTYRAHLDDDPAFQRRIAGLDPASAQQQAAALGRQTRATTSDLLANVVTGWMNLGPVASDALLGRAGRAGEQQLADAIRIVTHESVHAADPEVTGMSADGDLGFQEALAEKRSTTLPQLQRSRSVLGLDEQVGDAALTTSIAKIRPYGALESAFDMVLGAAGVQPGSAEAAQVAALPGKQAVALLATRAAAADHATPQAARSIIDEGFANIMRATRTGSTRSG